MLYDRKRSLLIYRIHKLMIATSAHESIHRILSVLRLSSKWKKGVSVYRISVWRNVDEICQKIKIIKSNFSVNPWRKKLYLIRSKEKNDIKDKFLDSGARSKESRRHQQTWNFSSEQERERREIRNHASPTLIFLFFALKEATKP